MSTIKAIIQLRRDTDYNFEQIKDNFIPLNGEVCLIDVASEGLRVKVGDGHSTYGQLQYADEDLRNLVQFGYYENENFYKDITKQDIIVPQLNKLYIDNVNDKIYYYDGQNYVIISSEIKTATLDEPGIIKPGGGLSITSDGTLSISEEYTQDILSQSNDAAARASQSAIVAGNYAADAIQAKVAVENKIWFGTMEEYNALETVYRSTIYIILHE